MYDKREDLPAPLKKLATRYDKILDAVGTGKVPATKANEILQQLQATYNGKIWYINPETGQWGNKPTETPNTAYNTPIPNNSESTNHITEDNDLPSDDFFNATDTFTQPYTDPSFHVGETGMSGNDFNNRIPMPEPEKFVEPPAPDPFATHAGDFQNPPNINFNVAVNPDIPQLLEQSYETTKFDRNNPTANLPENPDGYSVLNGVNPTEEFGTPDLFELQQRSAAVTQSGHVDVTHTANPNFNQSGEPTNRSLNQKQTLTEDPAEQHKKQLPSLPKIRNVDSVTGLITSKGKILFGVIAALMLANFILTTVSPPAPTQTPSKTSNSVPENKSDTGTLPVSPTVAPSTESGVP